ncbi:MAG: fibrillarin-like rRNA/tRNA 2'-O-methyltransferase [Candidatus Woesearchaeota archaeon]
MKKKPQLEQHMLGVYKKGSLLCTKNAVEGEQVYGERLMREKGEEYRIWDPRRSKLGAAIKNGISQIGIKPHTSVLYLGCSTGTTVSHVSEIVQDAPVYAVDVAPRVLRELYFLAKKRTNIVPILADASIITTLTQHVQTVDTLFMDIAQKNQVDIFLQNTHAFVKPGGFALLSIKARSIDVAKKPREIFRQVKAAIEKELIIVDQKTLEPFEQDHLLVVCKKK